MSLYDEYDLARALTYLLSHAGQPSDRDSYRYFGRTANLAAEENHANKIGAAVREVAPTTLGLSFGSTSSAAAARRGRGSE